MKACVETRSDGDEDEWSVADDELSVDSSSCLGDEDDEVHQGPEVLHRLCLSMRSCIEVRHNILES